MSDPYLRASIVLSDSTIYLEFSESLAWSSYEEGDFTLRINGSTSLSLYRMSSSGNHIYLRPQTPIYRGVTDVDISYSRRVAHVIYTDRKVPKFSKWRRGLGATNIFHWSLILKFALSAY